MVNDDVIGALDSDKGSESIIMVAGVGGAGSNAIRYMYELGIEGVEFMVCNTDQQSLDKSPIDNKIQLGREGLGAGNNPEVGRKLAIESIDTIKSRLKASNTKMLFITAGMGGGTGTGASPVIAKMAREEGILTVAIVTSPLSVEGSDRFAQAIEGIQKLRQYVDSLLIINNDSILRQYKDLSLYDAFRKADDILCSAAKGIAEIITVKSDMVNVDFADVKRVMSGSGTAHMSVAAAEGENRAMEVVETSLKSPLLDQNLISGAKNILVNFVTAEPNGLAASELNTILSYIQSHATTQDSNGKRHTANIIWGTSSKPGLGKKLELVVVATGFNTPKLGEDDLDDQLNDQLNISRETQEVVQVAQKESATQSAQETIAPVEQSPLEQVVLGNRKTSPYANIANLSKQPAYKTRKVELIVAAPNIRKETLQESGAENIVVPDSLLF